MSKPDLQPCTLLRTLCLIFSTLWAILPGKLHAATINVGPDQTHKTIQSALNDAVTGDTIFVEIGIYAENLTIPAGVDNLILEGEETARAVIDGGGTGTAIDLADFGNHITIRKFTIKTGAIGISIGSTGTSGAINITNNIIAKNTTGILCGTSSNITIINNTIDQNTTGISCPSSTAMVVTNNIVSNTTTTGTTGIDVANTATVTYNDVYNNGSNTFVSSTGNITTNPLLVDPTNNDYHLKLNSHAIDNGNPTITDLIDGTQSDIGAYGGPAMDVTPFQVQSIVPTPGTDSIALAWDANLAYDITSYKIYFDNQAHTITNNVPSPLYNNNLTVAATTTNCPSTPTPPTCTITLPLTLTAPTLSVAFGDQELFLSWSAPSGFNRVTGYNVYYMEQGGSAWTKVGVGNVTSYTLTGLTNFIVYDVYVTAVISSTFFINVTALVDFTTPHESDLLVPDVSTTLTCGALSCESPASAVVNDTPEPIAPFPDLPDQGHCFIATAAYGSPWEPQVKILRAFRDEYLEHYDLGRRFIVWYYHASPPWAQYLNEHVWLKPAVRVALMPAVGLAYFFVTATEIERFSIFLLLMLCLFGGMFVKRRAKRSRG